MTYDTPNPPPTPTTVANGNDTFKQSSQDNNHDLYRSTAIQLVCGIPAAPALSPGNADWSNLSIGVLGKRSNRVPSPLAFCLAQPPAETPPNTALTQSVRPFSSVCSRGSHRGNPGIVVRPLTGHAVCAAAAAALTGLSVGG